LFQIDDHSICTIAGWYSALGPIIKPDASRNPSYPAYLTVPDIIRSVISRISSEQFRTLSVERKMEILSNTLAFSLLVSANIYDAANITQSEEQLKMTSEITVAGYDNNGMLEILRMDLIPKIQNGKVLQYDMKEYPADYVSESAGFIPVIRGITTTAQSIFGGSFPAMYSADNYAYLGYFKKAIDDGDGNSLSLLELELFAREIERRTSQQYPNKVGGSQQVAILTNGKVTFYHQPISGTTPIPFIIFDSVDGLEVDGRGAGLLHVAAPQVAFVQRGKLSNGRQPMDNIFFFRSVFNHCDFIYSGSPRSIFDKSNTVVDSTLTLLPGADPNSNFVKQIKIDFPMLKIIDQTIVPHQ